MGRHDVLTVVELAESVRTHLLDLLAIGARVLAELGGRIRQEDIIELVPLVAVERPAVVVRDGDDVGSVFVLTHEATVATALPPNNFGKHPVPSRYLPSMQIRQLTQATITETEAVALARLRTAVDPRRLRSDPVVSRQAAIDELRGSNASYGFRYSALFDGDTMVGLAETQGALNGENTDACEVGIWVDPTYCDPDLPDYQWHHQLFEHIDAYERSIGRTRYWGWGDLDDPVTRGFWEGELGYTLAYDERISRCTLADVDAALMQQWIDRAADRANGYHLVAASAPFDDDVIELFAQGLEAMNDAPLDDIVQEHESFDAERARDVEDLYLSTPSIYRAIFAVETATGELGGYSAIRIPRADPSLTKQADTVTVNAHRNKGIGRWMKAEMWAWLRAEHPEVISLDTGNAESNTAMLAINEAMGFRDVLHHGVWHKLPATDD